MAQKDNKAKRARAQEGRRESGKATQETAVSDATNRANEELANASRDYSRAIYQAWLRAAEETAKVNLEFAASQQRVMQETGAQRTAAYFNLLGAAQDSSANTGGTALKEAHESCSKAFEEIAKTERSGWNELQQNRQRVLAAVSEAYTNALQEALSTYLSRIKEVWSSIDISEADSQTLTSLIAASDQAVRATQATSRHGA